MQTVSNDFHSATYSRNPKERILFRFADNTIFTNEDIHLNTGVKINESISLSDEFEIGSVTSSTMETAIINFKCLLSRYAFGECNVSLGILTETVTQNAFTGNCTAYYGYGTVNAARFDSYMTKPYLRVTKGAEAILTQQPPFMPKAILIIGNVVYCINLKGNVWGATWTGRELVPIGTMTTWSDIASQTWSGVAGRTWGSFSSYVQLNTFMKEKLSRWTNRGLSYDNNILHEYYVDGTIEKYEYCDLGVYVIEKPETRRMNLISVKAQDKMLMFDQSGTDFWNGITYPTTLGDIYTALCAEAGVTSATTTFLNSDSVLQASDVRPLLIDAEKVTLRNILHWIAEASCTFARMNRAGQIELTWFDAQNTVIPMNQYFNINIAEYVTQPINKVVAYNADSDTTITVGTGSNAYNIINNPFLYGDTDTEMLGRVNPLYTRLATFPEFYVTVVTSVCDWAIQAGDMVTVMFNNDQLTVPIFTQKIAWLTNAKVTYENNGDKNRLGLSASHRATIANSRTRYEIATSISKLNTRTLGQVAFADLSTAGNCDINAGNVTDGILPNARIDVDTLGVKHLDNATGTFTSLVGGNVEISTGGLVLDGTAGTVNIEMNPPTTQAQDSDAVWVYDNAKGRYVLSASSSTQKYKRDIETLDRASCELIIDALRPVRFRYINDSDDSTKSIGFIAEETDIVCPEVTVYDIDGNPSGVRYKHITALLIADNQRMHAEIKNIKQQLLTLIERDRIS